MHITAFLFCLFTLFSFNFCEMNIPTTRKTYNIYQWSTTVSLTNETFPIFHIKDSKNQPATNNITCVYLGTVTRSSAKKTILAFPNTTTCVLVHIGQESDLRNWVVGKGHLLNTVFPIGLLTAPLSVPSNSSTYVGKFMGWNKNEYLAYFNATLSVQIVILILHLMVISFGLYYLFLKYTQGQLICSFATVCIGLEVTGCLLWAIFSLVKVISMLNPNINLPDRLGSAINYVAFTFTFASGVFLLFFWLKITSKKLYRGAFLHRAIWPAILVVILIFIISVTGSILWLTEVESRTIYYFTSGILGLCLILGVIYYLAAIRVYLYTKDKDGKNRKLFRIIMLKILVNGTVMILIVVFSFSEVFSTRPGSKMVLYYFILFSVVLRSFLSIEIFSTGRNEKDDTSNDTSNSKNTPVNSTL